MIDRRTTGTQVEDEGIELRASNRISERFGDKAHVNVTSFNRSALLTGEVADENSRAALEKLVLGVPNVRGVTNDVAVAGASSFASRSNDSFPLEMRRVSSTPRSCRARQGGDRDRWVYALPGDARERTLR